MKSFKLTVTQVRVGRSSVSNPTPLNSSKEAELVLHDSLRVAKALKVAQFPLTSSTRKTGIGSLGLSVKTANLNASPFGRYNINGLVFALEVSPKIGVLQREQPISVGTTACCKRLMNLTISDTQFADRFAFRLVVVVGVLLSQLISSPPRYTNNLCLFQIVDYLKPPNLR